MPVINRVAEFHQEITAWRRDFHANPELLYDVHRTAGKVEEMLKSFGVDEIKTGLGRTGVVGIINGRSTKSGKVIGLRADMDALPITENTGKPYASTIPGKMHACGHDGHTAMLLGAAKYLAETRNFDGTVALIFQPAEEGGGGGDAMVKDGLMEKFGIEEVYGMHNFPGIPVGEFGIREGGIMAATDVFSIDIEGVGGHAALPHLAVDPIVTAAQMISGLQTLVSRNVDPVKSAVLSVTVIKAGEANNVIPRTAKITGTVRTLDEDVRDLMEQRLNDFVPQFAKSYGASASMTYRRGYPVTVNAPQQALFAGDVAALVAGDERVNRNVNPTMGGEDFSYMLQARPGAYILVGQGDTAGLHDDKYDFNDEIIPIGVSYWIKLAETAMPAAE
ncbi:M20 aminoacylase family protein [Mariluticola halotolerans]|uniref:M20 aminoacylase family protein n=1 Tax=Mariluticola halotolerans TaxID=2909283 RepID=UPI0026E1B6B2|nr:M20 aminoacylase family protein [Mariluticola halotolerans]UJQ92961.1 M20 family metallopeptidase [Mariluticola halotolerans]